MNIDKLKPTLFYVLNRLKEPSTWAGIAVFVGMFGLSEDTIAKVSSNGPAIAVAVASLVAIFAPSSGRKALGEVRDLRGEVGATAAPYLEALRDATKS